MFRVPLQHNSGRATSLAWMGIARFRSIKVIPLFRYSVIQYSAFYSVPLAAVFLTAYSIAKILGYMDV